MPEELMCVRASAFGKNDSRPVGSRRELGDVPDGLNAINLKKFLRENGSRLTRIGESN